MCGIIGLSGFPNSMALVKSGLKIMKNRGKDSSKIIKADNIFFGHNLHSIIDYVEQPLVSNGGVLVANCEIYNWKELNKKYSLNARNDAEMLLKLFELKGIKETKQIVNEFDGDFAFAYYSKKEKKLLIARDIAGVKPIVYFFDEKNNVIAFASEKKALPFKSIHLNPRKILLYDFKSNKISFINNPIKKETLTKKLKPEIKIEKVILSAISKRMPENKFALLLSGGVDSSFLAMVFYKFMKRSFVPYFAGIKDFSEPKDLAFAKKIANVYNSELKINLVSVKEFEKELPKIIKLIESTDPVRVGVASTIYFATKNVKEKVCFSGLGADELFAGYNRFTESTDIRKDIYSYFIKMYENDLYFEDIVCMKNKVELRVPFLDKKLIMLALSLPSKYIFYKGINKKILRELALKFGMEKEFAFRKKKAAQYGSNFDKAIDFLAKKNGFKSKALYLKSFASEEIVHKNISLGALISTGKDSLYALFIMAKQGYPIDCLITIDSSNKDSFMFHTPTVSLADLQAKALGKQIVIIKTKGEKEKELLDLSKAIVSAKKKFGIEGICSGALFSNYQRERIEKICEKKGIRAFAPLWQMKQEKYMRQIVKEKFVIMVTKIACRGLDESWLGRILTEKDVEELIVLSKKFGFNSAGEGGEYETLVLDMPLFSKKIVVKVENKMYNENTGDIKIIKAELVDK